MFLILCVCSFIHWLLSINMATIKEYFSISSPEDFSMQVDQEVQLLNGTKLSVNIKVNCNSESGSKYISIFIPKNDLDILQLMFDLTQKYTEYLKISNELIVRSEGNIGEGNSSSNDFQFTGRICFYTENIIDSETFKICKTI